MLESTQSRMEAVTKTLHDKVLSELEMKERGEWQRIIKAEIERPVASSSSSSSFASRVASIFM